MPHWRWMMMQLTRQLWVRATLLGMLGVAAAILAAFVERFIPWELSADIGADAVDGILNIIASSMLAVTTFSLSVMTAAYGAATSNVTPRATRLLMQDKVTQNVLSTFVGSFLFSIVGIVALKTDFYGERGRVVLFIVTVVVIVLIVVSLLRWIDHLIRLGRVGETTRRVEEAARQAILERMEEPYLGGRPLVDLETQKPANAVAIPAGEIGYVQYLDMVALDHCAQQMECDVFVVALPGTFVFPDTPLAWIDLPCDQKDPDAVHTHLRKAFSVGDERDFDQDPRFGLAVMSEIGSRALSAATNDPGTAIDVIGRMTRLMSLWADEREHEPEEPVRYPRVYVPPLRAVDLFEDAFMLMARDGAGLIEVQLRLQKTLQGLARMGSSDFREAASHQAQLARQRAERALDMEEERARLRALSDRPDFRL